MNQVFNNAVSHAAQTVGAPRRVSQGPRETEQVGRETVERETDPEKTRQTVRNQAGHTGAANKQKSQKTRIRRRLVRRGKAGSTGTRGEAGKTASSKPRWAPSQPQARSAPLGRTHLWNRLRGSASLNRASLAFEQRQANLPPREQNATGRNRRFLNNLVQMTRTSLAQHTGGDAGEAFSRRDTRQILAALTGMQKTHEAKQRRKTEDGRVRHTEAELKFKGGAAQALMAIFEPEARPADYDPISMVA